MMRSFVRLAAVMLACRYQLLWGEWLGHPWPRPHPVLDLIGFRDMAQEIGLLVEEARLNQEASA